MSFLNKLVSHLLFFSFSAQLINLGPSIFPHFTLPQPQPRCFSQPPPYNLQDQSMMTPPLSPAQPTPLFHNPTATRRASGLDRRQLYCHKCGRIDTPEWRKGPEGPATLVLFYV